MIMPFGRKAAQARRGSALSPALAQGGHERAVITVVQRSRSVFACGAYPRRRLGPFRHASLEVLEVLPHLLKRKSQREKPLGDVARQATDQAFGPHRSHFGGISLQCALYRPDR